MVEQHNTDYTKMKSFFLRRCVCENHLQNKHPLRVGHAPGCKCIQKIGKNWELPSRYLWNRHAVNSKKKPW